MGISVERRLQRDISLYPGYKFEGKKTKLKTLTKEFLSIDIQTGMHSSVEDARATLALYILKKQELDNSLKFLPDAKTN